MTYDAAFYASEGRVARTSARIVLPRILEEHPAETLIDIGCGTGEWALAAHEYGLHSLAVDHGVPVDQIVAPVYLDYDLSDGHPCGGFDLAVCVEVAEHLSESSAVPLVAGLARADAVLFSAATPGQPGVGHINCQLHDYWHDLFATHDLSPTFVGAWFTDPVADFYRRNLYLYRRGAR